MANPKLDKKVKAFLDSYLKGTDKNSAEYQHAIMLILRGALTDANFHSEARQLDKFFPKAKSSKYVGTDMETVIEDKGIDIAKAAKWDGYEIIDAFVAYTKNNKLDSLKEAFYSDFVSEFLKEVTHSHEYEDMSMMGEDSGEEIIVDGYQTKYFHVCPGATNLYKDIESKNVDMDIAKRSVMLQDALFFVEKHIQRDGYKPERDYVMVAKNLAKNIMRMAEMMGLEEEHQYIQGHVDTISNAVKEKGLEERVMKLTEENVPTDPSKWSYYKSQAKKKFDVYPSAYANAWAAKQYKDAGGGWRTKKKESVSEGMVEPRRGHTYYQLIKDAPVKYIESQSNPTGAVGVLLHNKDGYLKGKKGAYVIDYFGAHFYVDLKSKFATSIYDLKDQRELTKYIQPIGMAPEHSDWKKYMRDIPFTNESTINEVDADSVLRIVYFLVLWQFTSGALIGIGKHIAKFFYGRSKVKDIIKRIGKNKELVAAAKSKDEEKFFKLLSNTLSDKDFEVLMDTGASYTRLKRKVAKESMVEGVMSELDLMAKEASDFNDFLKDVFSVPAYRKHKGKKDVMDFLSKFYKDVRNESVNEGRYGTYDNAEAKQVDKVLDTAFKKFETALRKAHGDFQKVVKQYTYKGSKSDIGGKSGFQDSEGRQAIDYYAQKIIQNELGIDKFGSYRTGWMNESVVNEGRDVGHYERIGNQTIVDSNFVNYSKGILPNSKLVHLGMGDFALKTPNGDITFARSGKIDGAGQDFVGRPHRVTDKSNGKLVDELIKAMVKKKKAVLSMSESLKEAYVIFYAKKKGDKPSQAAYRDKDMALKFEKDLKKDGYITMVTQKKIKGVDESINEEYYKSASDAADAARKYAEKKGFEIDEDDWQTQIAMGGKHNRLRPGVGKTHSFSVGLTKNGKPQRKMLQISIFGMPSGKYELTQYIN